jgi:hypothetical protein
MLNYKINNDYVLLKKNFDLLYFKELINTSYLVIYFNCDKVPNKRLYDLKNEILKKNLKSFFINSIHVRDLFENSFKFLNSNMLFIFFNNFLSFLFIVDLLSNIKFFYFFDKCMGNVYCKSLSLNNNLIFFHFIVFKLLCSLLVIILFYVIDFIRNILNIFIKQC